MDEAPQNNQPSTEQNPDTNPQAPASINSSTGIDNQAKTDNSTATKATVSVYIFVALIIGAAYLGKHVFPTKSVFHDLFYVIMALAVIDIIYFGWVKRTLAIGARGQVTARVVTGGWAVVLSFLYIAIILIVGGVAWSQFK